MRARTAEIEITYNGVPASDKMADSELECTYTDPASGEADGLDISIHDRERKWINSWLPQTGDRLTAAIALKNWDSSGADRRLDCGSFVLDTFTFSGWPISGTISAVSVPADGNFRARKRSKVWENITCRKSERTLPDAQALRWCGTSAAVKRRSNRRKRLRPPRQRWATL